MPYLDRRLTVMEYLSIERTEHIRILIAKDKVAVLAPLIEATCRDLCMPVGEFLQEFCYPHTSLNLLHIAAARGAVGVVSYYFDTNPQVGRRQILLGEPDCKGLCPIHHAARQGHNDMIDVLLAGGDSLDRRTEDGTMNVADVAGAYGQTRCLGHILKLKGLVRAGGNGRALLKIVIETGSAKGSMHVSISRGASEVAEVTSSRSGSVSTGLDTEEPKNRRDKTPRGCSAERRSSQSHKTRSRSWHTWSQHSRSQPSSPSRPPSRGAFHSWA